MTSSTKTMYTYLQGGMVGTADGCKKVSSCCNASTDVGLSSKQHGGVVASNYIR